MKIESRKYRLNGLTEILGSQSANPDIWAEYIATKNPAFNEVDNELSTIAFPEDRGLTVFLRDPKTGGLMIQDYVIKGFLKEAVNFFRPSLKIAAPKNKVNNLVFVFPRHLVFKRNGKILLEEDNECSRPIRIDSAQGPRSAIARSEMLNTPWELEFTLKLLPNMGTKVSKALTFDAIEEALNYGSFKGIGQFRNGSYGRFTWERMEEYT